MAEAAEATEATKAAVSTIAVATETAETTIAEAAQTAEAAIAEAAQTAESAVTAVTAIADAMMDSCHGDGFREVGSIVAGASHGDQTEQKKHSSDLHFDLRRRKAAWVYVFSTAEIESSG